MLTAVEKESCKSILEACSMKDIESLVETVTKKQIRVTSKSEAIKAVLDFSRSAGELLRRRKMRRDVLFQYLIKQQTDVSPSIDKPGLIRRILELWGSDLQDSYMDIEDDDDSVTDSASSSGSQSSQTKFDGDQSSQSSFSENQPPQTVLQNKQQRGGSGAWKGETLFDRPINIRVPRYTQNVHKFRNIVHDQSSPDVGSSPAHQNSDTLDSERDHPHNQLQTNLDRPGHSQMNVCSGDSGTLSTKHSEHQLLGEQFVSWFYDNLNSHNPSMNQTPADFGPHHFWSDVHFELHASAPDQHTEKIEGQVLVAQRLLALPKEHGLLFNPNKSSEGIFVKSNPHGMVQILVCGTLHVTDDCIGIFQQTFGIVRDPRFDNNWKIKMTKLYVQTSRPTEIPKLSGNPEEMLALTAS